MLSEHSCSWANGHRAYSYRTCSDDLQVDLPTGKRVLTVVLNGGAIPIRFASNLTLQALHKASRYLRPPLMLLCFARQDRDQCLSRYGTLRDCM